jgi:hypothetical protein
MTMAPTAPVLGEPVHIDDIRSRRVSPAELRAQFARDGFLHVRGLVSAKELAALHLETWAIIEQARMLTPARPSGLEDDAYEAFVGHYAKQPLHAATPLLADTYFHMHRASGRLMPRAVDHIAHYSLAARGLLGHPGLLEVVEAMQGPEFITTSSPMVLKYPGGGAMVPWHRDALRPKDAPAHIPTFTADVYLDASTRDTSVWVAPGTHQWTPEDALADCIRRNENRGFKTDGAVPIIVEAGDLLLHHTWLNHGSDDSSGGLRRAIYFQFLPMEFAKRMFHDTYLRHTHRRLAMSIAERQGLAHCAGETPYSYRTNVAFAEQADPDWRDLPPYRLRFWHYRKDA